nr:protein TPX2 [Tanacetum cinerariifolium]
MSVDLARLIGRWWNIHIPIFDDPSSWDSWLNGILFRVCRPLIEVQEFDIHVDSRGVDRAEFDKKIKEKEMMYHICQDEP